MAQIKVKTKPDELCARLNALASQLGPGAKMPTAREMSHQYGVSPTTLQVALGRVEAEGMIRRRHGSGIFVADSVKAARRNIALVYNYGYMRVSNHSPFWDSLLERVQTRAAASKESFHLHCALPGPKGVILQENLRTEITSGALHGILGVGLDWATWKWIEAQGALFVGFAGPGTWGVQFDALSIINQGVAELARQGCQTVTLFNPPAPYEPHGDILDSMNRTALEFRTAALEQRLEIVAEPPGLDPDLTGALGEYAELSTQEQGYRAAMELFGGPGGPEGLVITNDLMAHGVLVALEKLGLRAGHDVKIVTHANKGSSVLAPHTGITLLEYDAAELVDTMFSTLETLMDGGFPAVPQTLIRPHLRLAAN